MTKTRQYLINADDLLYLVLVSEDAAEPNGLDCYAFGPIEMPSLNSGTQLDFDFDFDFPSQFFHVEKVNFRANILRRLRVPHCDKFSSLKSHAPQRHRLPVKRPRIDYSAFLSAD